MKRAGMGSGCIDGCSRTGIDNVVVDSSSIEVNRRARRAKTDRLDARQVAAAADAVGRRGAEGVERGARADAGGRSRAAADARDRRRCARIGSGCAIGSTGCWRRKGFGCALTRRFWRALATVQTGDGRPLPAALRERLEREWAHLETIEARLTALCTARATRRSPTGADRVAEVARQLCTLRGVAETSAALYSAELFGTRTFRNGRQLGALTGLVPVPYRSDQRVRTRGSVKPGARSCGGSRCSWRGAGCAGSRTAR